MTTPADAAQRGRLAPPGETALAALRYGCPRTSLALGQDKNIVEWRALTELGSLLGSTPATTLDPLDC
jgi:hypothetical protein